MTVMPTESVSYIAVGIEAESGERISNRGIRRACSSTAIVQAACTTKKIAGGPAEGSQVEQFVVAVLVVFGVLGLLCAVSPTGTASVPTRMMTRTCIRNLDFMMNLLFLFLVYCPMENEMDSYVAMT